MRGAYGYVRDLVERWAPDALVGADRLGRKQPSAILREHLSHFGIPPDSPFYTKVLRWAPCR